MPPDIAKISVMSRALLHNIYVWQKVIKTNEMTENSSTLNDCRVTYMLDFILKPVEKLAEYQDNASLLKFKGNPSINTCRKSRWKLVCE